MAVVDDLVKELEAQSDVYHAWDASKKEIQKGTAATRANEKYTKAVEGVKTVDNVEAFAADFYEAAGYGGDGNKAMLAHNLRRDLGDNYGAFRSAIKHGDVDTANKLARDAVEGATSNAGLASTIERIQAVSPDDRIKAGKKLVKLVGGKDYAMAASRPEGIATALNRMKQVAEQYQ